MTGILSDAGIWPFSLFMRYGTDILMYTGFESKQLLRDQIRCRFQGNRVEIIYRGMIIKRILGMDGMSTLESCSPDVFAKT
jgi:hypothetical protein